jgi:hypothetical protein
MREGFIEVESEMVHKGMDNNHSGKKFGGYLKI